MWWLLLNEKRKTRKSEKTECDDTRARTELRETEVPSQLIDQPFFPLHTTYYSL